MKKIISTLVIICMLLITVASCNNGKDIIAYKDKTLDIPVAYELYDITIDEEGNIYACDKDKIHILDINGSKTAEITQGLDSCTNIAYNMSKKTLYTLNAQDTQLNLYNHKGDNIESLMINPINTDGTVIKMETKGDFIFFLEQDNLDYTKKYIIVYNIKDGKTEFLEYENVMAFTTYSDNSICIITDGTQIGNDNIIIYDYEKGMEKGKYKVSLPTIIKDISYKNEGKILYFTQDQDTLKSTNLDNTSIDTIFRKSESKIIKTIFYKNVCFFLCKEKDNKNNNIHAVNIENFTKSNSKTLNVFVHNSAMERESIIKNAIDGLQQDNPGINVKFKSVEYEKYLMEIKKRLSAGESNFDIYYVNNNESYEILKNETWEDLSLYPEISANFDNMIEGIKHICEYNGKIPGIPWTISFDVWNVNEALLKKLNLNIPVNNWTWKDFYSIAKNAKSDLNGDGANDIYALEYYKRFFIFLFANSTNSRYYDALNGKANYDNEEFINVLELGKKLWKEKLVNVYDKFNAGSSNEGMKDNILFYPVDAEYSGLDNEKWIAPPSTSHNDFSYPIGINMLCINIHSKNKQIAAEFLDHIISNNKPNNHPIYDLGTINNSNEKSNFEVYKYLLKYGERSQFNDDLQLFIADTVEQFFKDKISAQETAKLIQKKAEMIANE